MAASLLRVGRLSVAKCLHLECYWSLSRAPAAAAFSSKTGGSKKKNNLDKSTKTYFDIEKLVQHKPITPLKVHGAAAAVPGSAEATPIADAVPMFGKAEPVVHAVLPDVAPVPDIDPMVETAAAEMAPVTEAAVVEFPVVEVAVEAVPVMEAAPLMELETAAQEAPLKVEAAAAEMAPVMEAAAPEEALPQAAVSAEQAPLKVEEEAAAAVAVPVMEAAPLVELEAPPTPPVAAEEVPLKLETGEVEPVMEAAAEQAPLKVEAAVAAQETLPVLEVAAVAEPVMEAAPLVELEAAAAEEAFPQAAVAAEQAPLKVEEEEEEEAAVEALPVVEVAAEAAPPVEVAAKIGPLVEAVPFVESEEFVEKVTDAIPVEVTAAVLELASVSEKSQGAAEVSQVVEVVTEVVEAAADVVSEAMPVVEVIAAAAADVGPVVEAASVLSALMEAPKNADPAADKPTEAVSSEAAGEETTLAPLDPIQKLFLEAIRGYSSQSLDTSVHVGPEYQKALAEETAKLRRLFGGGDLESFPEFKFQEPKFEDLSQK